MEDPQGNQIMELSDVDSLIIVFNLVQKSKDKLEKFNTVSKLHKITNKSYTIENSQ